MTSVQFTSPVPLPPRAWSMVGRGFLAQNFADSLAFGGFGISVLAIQAHYDTSRAVAALGISLIAVSMGVMSPIMSVLIERLTIRGTMYCGIVIAAMGYLVLAIAPNIFVFLAAYLFLVGPGAILMGAFPSSILAANWFAASGGAGRAVGIVNMPVFMMLVPAIGVGLLQNFGLRGFFLAIAAAHVIMLPIIQGVVDRPPAMPGAVDIEAHAAPEPTARRQLIGKPAFWALAFGGGLPNAIAAAGIAHMVGLAVERGHSFAEAGLLPAVMGAAGIAGAVGIGALCDRIGAALTLALMGCGLACGWGILLVASSIPAMAAACFVIGLGTGGTFTAQSALARTLFGITNLARVIGLAGLFGLPILFVLPPLAGYFRDISGSYEVTVGVLAGFSLLVAAIFMTLVRRGHNGPQDNGPQDVIATGS